MKTIIMQKHRQGYRQRVCFNFLINSFVFFFLLFVSVLHYSISQKVYKQQAGKTEHALFLFSCSKNNVERWKRKEAASFKLNGRKKNPKEIKRRKNYQYAIKHMFDKSGRRIKDINKERKSLKKKKLFDYEGFKVDKIFTCLSNEEMEELREEELKRKSGEILYNNKYIDNYGVESDSGLEQM